MAFGGQGPYGAGNPYGPGHPHGSGSPYGYGPGTPGGPGGAPGGYPPDGGNPYGGGPHLPPRPPVPPPYVPPPRPTLRQQFRADEWPTLRQLLHRTDLNGCYLLPLLMCCMPLLLLVLAYPVARSARKRARTAFPADLYRYPYDPEVWRVQKIRAWLALAASLAILVAYGTGEDWSEVQDQFLLRVTITPWLLLLTAPVVILVLLRLAPDAARPGMRSRLRPPVRMVFWYVGSFTLVPLLFAGVMLLSETYQGRIWAPFLTMVLLAPVLWMLCFVGFGSATVVRTAFGTSAVHAALPALLTGVLVWELAAVNLLATGMPPGPPLVQVLAVFCGPLSVTGVAWWEVERLRTRHGVRLRA
ncbi:hypothetical protein [Streptomyces sp. NPDC090026]|uniref:hypothetical protein n=1 Tax=Streptomyces sp. NPDC090026 TaxID=3365923 RepID=UPI00380594BF